MRKVIKESSKLPSNLTSPSNNPLDNWISLERITVGKVTAPRNMPDEAPGLKTLKFQNLIGLSVSGDEEIGSIEIPGE